MTVIKGTVKYRRTRRHDYVSDFLPPSKKEINYAFEEMMRYFDNETILKLLSQKRLDHNYLLDFRVLRIATGSVMFSTLEDGKIVRGLSGVPDEGPVLLVGYHNLMGFELFSLVEEFLRQKKVVARGVAHPQLFVTDSGDSLPEFSMNDWFKVFGALPVTPSNLFKLLSSKSHVLLYPGGAREALHFKVYPLCFFFF